MALDTAMSLATIEVHRAQMAKNVQIVMPQPLATQRQQSNMSTAKSEDASMREDGWLGRIKEALKMNMLSRFISLQSRNAAAKMSIKEKIHPRYLEFEPLCCLSSCLVRGGCYSVAAFEVFYVFLTGLVIALKIHDGGRMDFWDDLDTLNYNAIVTHQVSLYLLALFDLVTLCMVSALCFGLFTFQRFFIKIHWRFDFFSLVFNIIVFILYSFALSSEGPESWTWKNVILVISFATHIPVQIWAIFVVKSCYDFYVLLYVFVSLAEK